MTAGAIPAQPVAPPTVETRRVRLAPLVRNPLVLGGVLLALLYLLTAALAPLLAPADPTAIDPSRALAPPSPAAPFGTDRFGRDVLSRAIHGTRVSLLVGIVSIAAAASLGAVVGLMAGYRGGLLDELVGRVMDVFFTFPSLILAISISVALGLGAQNAVLAIAATYWPSFGRVVRGAVVAERGKEYVQAAKVLGAADGRVMWRHLLPNVLSPLIVQVTVGVSHAILVESSLSYLGLGTQPPTPSWGTMINEGRTLLQAAPWISVFPGAAIMGAVLAFNLLGDGLRDVLDPRLGTHPSS